VVILYNFVSDYKEEEEEEEEEEKKKKRRRKEEEECFSIFFTYVWVYAVDNLAKP